LWFKNEETEREEEGKGEGLNDYYVHSTRRHRGEDNN